MYTLKFATSSASKFIKKADPALKAALQAEFKKIVANPEAAQMLRGIMFRGQPIRSHHFRIRSAGEYRIAYYSAPEPENCVYVLALGPREKFYERLKASL